jgi:hypothetical protein
MFAHLGDRVTRNLNRRAAALSAFPQAGDAGPNYSTISAAGEGCEVFEEMQLCSKQASEIVSRQNDYCSSV